jgi:hypothetical protein
LMMMGPDPKKAILPSQECWGVKGSRVKCK